MPLLLIDALLLVIVLTASYGPAAVHRTITLLLDVALRLHTDVLVFNSYEIMGFRKTSCILTIA